MRQLTVLIVEDEPLLLDVVDRSEGRWVRGALRIVGPAGDRVATWTHAVDIFFTDIQLGGPISGWKLAEIALGIRPGMHVFYATGYTDELPSNVKHSQLFIKPYRIPEILETMVRLAGTAEPIQE